MYFVSETPDKQCDGVSATNCPQLWSPALFEDFLDVLHDGIAGRLRTEEAVGADDPRQVRVRVIGELVFDPRQVIRSFGIVHVIILARVVKVPGVASLGEDLGEDLVQLHDPRDKSQVLMVIEDGIFRVVRVERVADDLFKPARKLAQVSPL